METSNISDVMSNLKGVIDGFNFTVKGADQSLGRDVAKLIVKRIADRSLSDQGPAGGGEWPKNAPAYAAYKEKRYGVPDPAPNVRTGQMLSAKSLMGTTIVEAYLITMRYGVGEPPDRTGTGVPLAKADTKRTDIEKAYYAHTGQSKKKIKRPFYEVDEADGIAVVELCQKNLNAYIEATNAGH
jgi:hypothetical protein